MHEFTVWAPSASKMGVKIGDVTYPMSGPDEHGWWSASVEQAGPGTDYGFVIGDDPKAWPDPRSEWQPDGVHGLSRVYDQRVFKWSDRGWSAPALAHAVIYELHVGTFTPQGTFDSAIEKLGYLVELGITHVELMPVAAFPGGQGWGYDGAALFAVTEQYGGPDGLKRLVDACHARGLAVLLDVVYNHFGPVGNYSGKYGPYITERHHTPWGGAINFEGEGSDEVRRFFCDNALMWMRDYHIDGLRLDAVHEYVDRSAIHFMEQLSFEVKALSAKVGRRLVLIAESDLNDPRVVTPARDGGYGMDAQWSDDFHHALFTVLTNEGTGKGYYSDFGTLEKLAKSLAKNFVQDGSYSEYRRRSHGRPADDLSPHHFLGYIQNHDQVGNRAVGDRVDQTVGFDRAKVAAAIVMTAPFIPMIFQGEEYAASTPFQYFADHEDPEMAKSVKNGRRGEFAAFGWNPEDIPDPEDVETFLRSKLNWEEIHQGRHGEMLDWYRRLIQLRRGSVALNDGAVGHVKATFDEKGRWLIFERGVVTVMCNLGSEKVELPHAKRSALLLGSKAEVVVKGGAVELPTESVAILSSETLR
ncbi:malto-oligosyltrehalose trehalohydrolase [Tunturiibacter gelidoferens]|uniref:Malto-oligosyltrehalose trehalohydrolase n=2 Tax=Tunturiibacter TaxID=3154218 RepID=A0A7Y9NPD0_9BACT|nr:malto-oligosyltrehalose trehalohydrolase [Edaphobacter lichenicola]MBB5341695.1 maltooligosyltrehalose trehalohydrolase [Edaphobacter lichenicola]NYF53079.1 maltooligosyltrehalose trehalohydrolase [Edaphobacter lichenicola]